MLLQVLGAFPDLGRMLLLDASPSAATSATLPYITESRSSSVPVLELFQFLRRVPSREQR
jgi:hypothetical protein